MTTYNDPNREAVGLEPIWTGAEAQSEASPEVEESPAEETYDPGEHTVTEVEDYVDANPDQLDAVLAAERAGKNRSTLVASLESFEVAE